MVDFRDVSFLIPMKIDSDERLKNIELCVDYLNRGLNTNIYIAEETQDPKLKEFSKICNYKWVSKTLNFFHRTKLFNDLCKSCKTSIICLYDCDVFLPYNQYILARDMILSGYDMIIPYDGTAYDIPRNNIKHIRNSDMNSINLNICKKRRKNSIGGAIFFNKDSYIKGGMENENFKSWGGEDDELYNRFNKLGFKVNRTIGYLLHLIHKRGSYSIMNHLYYKNNVEELEKIKKMNKEQLEDYIKTWSWVR